MRVDGEQNYNVAIGVGVRPRSVMLPCLFNIFMDGYMRVMKTKVESLVACLKINGVA